MSKMILATMMILLAGPLQAGVLGTSDSANRVVNGDFAVNPQDLGWTVDIEGNGILTYQLNVGLDDNKTGSVDMSVSAPGDAVRLVSQCIAVPSNANGLPHLLTIRYAQISSSVRGSVSISQFSDPSCTSPAGGAGFSASLGLGSPDGGQFSVLSRRANPGSVQITLALAHQGTSTTVRWDAVSLRAPNLVTTPRGRLWLQADLFSGEENGAGDAFGSAAAAADFNGDGFDDAAIAAPLEDYGADLDRGRVLVAYGSPSGLSSSGAQQLTPPQQPVQRVGEALAAGDFNCDGFDDLAIGAPVSNTTVFNAGAVYIVYGSAAGLDDSVYQRIDRDSGDINGASTVGDRFGAALAAGNFDGDRGGSPPRLFECIDLAVGSPGADISGQDNAGAVFLLFGGPNGIETSFDNPGGRIWHQNRSLIAGVAEENDEFGAAVASRKRGFPFPNDLVVGAPGDEFSGQIGAVHLIPGLINSQFLDQANSRLFTATDASMAGVTLRQLGGAVAAGEDYSATSRNYTLAAGAPGTDLPPALAFQIGGHVTYDLSTTAPPLVILPPAEQTDSAYGSQVLYADTLNRGLAAELWTSAPGINQEQGSITLNGRALIGPAAENTVPTTELTLADFGEQPDMGDRFGQMLVRGNFNGIGGDELLIGIPGWDTEIPLNPPQDIGAVLEVTFDGELIVPLPDGLFGDSFEALTL